MNLPPQIIAEGLPENEREVAHHIELQLNELRSLTERFQASLLLIERSEAEDVELALRKRAARQQARDAGRAYEFQESSLDGIRSERRVRRLWKQIAERDAVMTIQNFSKTVYDIRKCLDRIPTLNGLVSRRELEKPIAALSVAFPDKKIARNVSAHPADMRKHPKEVARHATNEHVIRGGLNITGARTTLHDVSLGDGTILWTHEGKVIEIQISDKSHATLCDITAQVYACFENAAVVTQEAFLRGLRASPPEPSGSGD
jgi:hypothetical protein